MCRKLANGEFDIKIIDFGLSMVSDKKMHTSSVGTPYYVAPEIINGKHDYKCDIWSLGVLMYILLSGYMPFPGKSSDEILVNVLKAKYTFVMSEWDSVSSEAKDLISHLLVKNPKKRYTASEALEHPWFKMEPETAQHTLDSEILVKLKNYHSKSKFY